MPNARPVAEHLWCCAHVLGHAALQHAGLEHVLGAPERAGPALGLCLQPRTAQVASKPRPEPHFSPAHSTSRNPAPARLRPASLRVTPPFLVAPAAYSTQEDRYVCKADEGCCSPHAYFGVFDAFPSSSKAEANSSVVILHHEWKVHDEPAFLVALPLS